MTNILTLRVDQVSQARFDTLRRLHFPAERNQIAAHVTLFHSLPDEPWVEERFRIAAGATRVFPVDVTGLQFLGKGVAYRLHATELGGLHSMLARDFVQDLTPQDRQRFQPHVVVQNKVTPAAARELFEELREKFTPWRVEAEGLDLWHYQGGPWKHAETFQFRAEDSDAQDLPGGEPKNRLA